MRLFEFNEAKPMLVDELDKKTPSESLQTGQDSQDGDDYHFEVLHE